MSSENRDRRNRTIKSAVLTSLLSKFGTLALRIISIPIAIHVLGMEQFGVYATILVAVQMMDVFHLGIGPALTQKLSKASLENDQAKEARLFSTSMIISSAITFLIALILIVAVCTIPITDLFGDKYASYSETMRRSCLIGIGIIAVELVCLVAERARDGYMETRYTNLWGAGGNFLAAALLLIGIWKFPTTEFLVLAINGSVVLAKFGNMVHMMVQRPYLLPRFRTFSQSMVKMLMSGALIFTIVYGSSGIMEYNIIGYLVGRFLGPEQAANYSILISLHVMMTGIIYMLTVPIWPAIIDAYERRELDWVIHTAKRLRLTAFAFGATVLTGMSFFGLWAIKIWIGEGFSLEQGALIAFGSYFTLHLWRHVNQILCLGLSRENAVAKIVLAETFTTFTVSIYLLKQGYSIPHILAAFSVIIVCFSGWLYPLIYRNTLESTTENPQPTEPEPHEVPGHPSPVKLATR
ncbi:MAG: hypothetical protein P1U89_13965 [Verrucomicrobiales bacterium]|nr:hypothetical protein [Verrucomicrobiales bacterium]